MIMEKRKEIGRWHTKDKEGEKFAMEVKDERNWKEN